MIARRVRIILTVIFMTLPAVRSNAGEVPPDVEAARLEASLAVDPVDVAGWIRLGDLQRFMGYRTGAARSLDRARDLVDALPEEEARTFAGTYYLARAWLAYERCDWERARDLAEKAVRHDPRTETWLIRGLATASIHYPRGVFGKVAPPELKRVAKPLRTSFLQGWVNGTRNGLWFSMVRMHSSRYLDKYTRERTIAGYRKPPYFWGEMECRRDWGAYFEDKAMWEQARQMYLWSAERSPVSEGTWARRHERLTPRQDPADRPLPFWTNADGGYVTGSPLAYGDYACERLMAARTDADRRRWADNLAFGATRCLGVLANHPLPWLWRGFADLVRGNVLHAGHDIAQARAEFDARGMDPPLYAFVHGHEMVLKGRHLGAVQWLEKAAEGWPDDPTVWAELGTAYGQARRPAEALMAFDRALALEPGMVSALYNRGMIHLQTGRPAEAEADLIRAMEGDPGNLMIMTGIQRAHVLARASGEGGASAGTP